MKYKLTDKTIQYKGKALYQIEALKDFGYVKKGDLGGWIESEDNLSQEGDCWVADNAKVYGWAIVYDNAIVCGNATVYGHAEVYGNAEVWGDTEVYGDAEVYDYAQVYGNTIVGYKARVYGNARICADSVFSEGCFIGGIDRDGITEITHEIGTDYWKHQYVLGAYKIESINTYKTKLLEKADELMKKAEELIEQTNTL